MHQTRQRPDPNAKSLAAIATDVAEGGSSGKAVPETPETELNAMSLNRRGHEHAMAGRWDEALVCFRDASAWRPNDSAIWYVQAIACMATGDVQAHRRTISEMLLQFGQTKDPKMADRILYACLPLADVDLDIPQLVSLARAATGTWKGNERVLAAALYRAGQYEDALQHFQQSHKVFSARAWDQLFLAMIHHRLAKTNEAEDYLRKAQEWIRQSDIHVTWMERVEVEHLLHEAEALIGKTP